MTSAKVIIRWIRVLLSQQIKFCDMQLNIFQNLQRGRMGFKPEWWFRCMRRCSRSRGIWNLGSPFIRFVGVRAILWQTRTWRTLNSCAWKKVGRQNSFNNFATALCISYAWNKSYLFFPLNSAIKLHTSSIIFI